MFDLIIRNANLPDGRQGFDIGLAGGKIAAIEKSITATPARRSTRPAAWSARPSAIRISTWMRRCRSVCRA